MSSLSGKETILVVEDQVEVRIFTAAALRDYGYRVFEAVNAEEAVAICGRSGAGIHLVLTDVVMPRTSGPEAGHKGQEDPAHHEGPLHVGLHR